MRLTLCNELVKEWPIERQAAFAAAVGYDALEIAPFTLSDEPHRLPDAKVAEIRRAVETEGLSVSGIHFFLMAPAGLSITTADSAVRDKTFEAARGLIALTAALGGHYVVHGSPAQRRLDPGDEQAGLQRARDFIELMAPVAEAVEVTYLIEPLSPDQTKVINTVAEAAALVDRIGSHAVRTMIDCSSAGRTDTEEAVPILIDRYAAGGPVRHIHFNDPNKRGPGEGAMVFAPIMERLIANQYEGWIGVEPFVWEPDGPTCAARAAGYIRALEDACRR